MLYKTLFTAGGKLELELELFGCSETVVSLGGSSWRGFCLTSEQTSPAGTFRRHRPNPHARTNHLSGQTLPAMAAGTPQGEALLKRPLYGELEISLLL